MNRRSFFGGIAGAFAATVVPAPASGQLPIQRGSGGFGSLSEGCTGITHVFIGPTGPADYQLIGNLNRSFSYRGQSCMSPESLGWMRRHHGIVLTPYAERDKYVVPGEYSQWLDSCGTWRRDK